MIPFVKWVGGKRQLLRQLVNLIPKNYNRYFEPFIGGGALLLEHQPKDAVINDKNDQLINVYLQIRDDCDSVIDALNVLESLPCDETRFMTYREKFNDMLLNRTLTTDSAAMFIFINKHCFNGIYRLNRSGKFNVGYNKSKTSATIDKHNIREISNYLNRNDIEILNVDFVSACKSATSGDFIYLDPPYFPINDKSFVKYTSDSFLQNDHSRVYDLFCDLTSRGVFVVMSNSDSDFINDAYKDFHIRRVPVRRSVNSDGCGRSGFEVIVTNYECSCSDGKLF